MKYFPELEELKQGAVILIDKPYTWTSFDAIAKVRRYLDRAKIGHCGTLDPLATGLLICCTGKFTKRITDYQKMPKVYTGIIHLGATTPTFDLESDPENEQPIEQIDEKAIVAATALFKGDIQQMPPIHSAIKKDGKRAYEYARKGEEVKLQPRAITIDAFDILKVEGAEVHFRVACSTGTYIRSLANDLGAVLGCGGYLQELRRTKIGDFKVEDAPEITEWVSHLTTPPQVGYAH